MIIMVRDLETGELIWYRGYFQVRIPSFGYMTEPEHIEGNKYTLGTYCPYNGRIEVVYTLKFRDRLIYTIHELAHWLLHILSFGRFDITIQSKVDIIWLWAIDFFNYRLKMKLPEKDKT